MAAPKQRTYVFSKGDRVWVPVGPPEAYALATVKSVHDKKVSMARATAHQHTHTTPTASGQKRNKGDTAAAGLAGAPG